MEKIPGGILFESYQQQASAIAGALWNSSQWLFFN